MGPWVWRFDPATGEAAVAADGFVKPNGVTFSPDFQTAYVTETGAVDGTAAPADWGRAAPAVYAFDVQLDGAGRPTLANRRLLAVSLLGIPDGLKADRRGNLYAGVPGGVDVFAPDGQHLGSLLVGHTADLAFCGERLVMLQEQRVTAVRLKARGVQLPYQEEAP